MIDYERKFDIVYNVIQHGKPIGEKGTSLRIDLHHTFLHDTKSNHKKYPYLTDSVFNLFALWHNFHDANRNWKPFELSEAFLREIEKALAAFDDAVRAISKTFDELYNEYYESIRADYYADFYCEQFIDDEENALKNYKLFITRLYAAFKYLWDKRR